ncbi:HlyD family secretion protein [Vibrio sp. S11_S32]|uniref:HlyD family secretion protein n=1 Tax=Vibrio sp. S11_S32 TaxID=2720225 RepID=UPI0016803516|nr:HlyD family secretion protein [Vibrio sp. S11_S32]MBD1575191.1 HlyD family secretion protein [Vibrio sp. S11_S32]
MDLLLILTYAAFCVAIFKIFRIPLNKWTVPTAVLGGIALIGTLILLMNYNHPFTQVGGQIYATTPIVPNVRGRVTEVPVKPNTLLQQGDVLFKIDDTPFKSVVTQRKAMVAAAQQNVLRLESSYKQAQSIAAQAEAERDKAKREAARYLKGYKHGAFTVQQVDDRQQASKAAQAAYNAAIASANEAKLAFESQVDGINTDVAEAQARLDKAEFDLDQTTVRAPTTGYVTQLALHPGMMAVPLPLKPMLTFVNKQDRYFVGAFRQNSLQRLSVGDDAELLFRSIPGRVFKAKLVQVIPAIAEGQIQASGSLLGTSTLNTQGRTMVLFKVTDDLSSYNLPLGVNAEIAVYTEHFHHVAVMRKVLIRMKSWQNYIYLDH